MPARKKRKTMRPWRKYLTEEERDVIAQADAARRVWTILNAHRAGIQNRATQRAKQHAEKSA